MRIAALYDIHGNLPALEAVLASLGDVDLIVVGGDVVWGPWPRECMDLLCARPNAFLMGNADREVFDRVQNRWANVNDWCADRLSEAHLSLLRSCPVTLSYDGVLYCHGTPRSDVETLTTDTPEERVAEVCAGVEEHVIVCGHTHAQFDREVAGKRIVNAGSVGNPFGEPSAYWAAFDGGEVDLRFTPYDTGAAAAAIRASGYPDAEAMAAQVEAPGPAEMAAQIFTNWKPSGSS